jgi:signal transduction histidine kinase
VADTATNAMAHVAPGAAAVLVRELVSHAIAASRRGTRVAVDVRPREGDLGWSVTVDDSGVPLPAGARGALLGLKVEPGTFGRPSSVSLFIAAEIAAAQGAVFDIGDAPADSGSGGGVRVTVTFPG